MEGAKKLNDIENNSNTETVNCNMKDNRSCEVEKITNVGKTDFNNKENYSRQVIIQNAELSTKENSLYKVDNIIDIEKADFNIKENKSCQAENNTKIVKFSSKENSLCEVDNNVTLVEDINIFSESECDSNELLKILDFSSGSSDNYIPNSESSDTSDDDSISSKPKKKHTKLNHVVIPESSDSDNSIVEPQPGCSSRNVKKLRKSLKERRSDRKSRLLLRNAGKCYVTKLGKLKSGRNLAPLTDCRMKCKNRIPETERESIFMEYWLLGSYDERAKYVERFIQINKKRTHKIASKCKRGFTNTYKLIYFTNEYQICKGCLLKTLGESNRFIQTVCEKIKKFGRVTKSERGRAASYKKVSELRLKEVEEHINKFPAYESHYSRSKTSKKYLSSDLSLDAMYRLYCAENENPVSKTIYGTVFKDMNLSFKKPSVDTCNKCNLLINKLKFATDPEERRKVQEQLELHQEEYECAYAEKRKDKDIAKNNADTCVIAFDLQQCLPTPMLNTQSAFYKRQLWVFNLTIHDFLTNHAYCYMWPESSGGRGANQIASCLYDFITVRLPLLHPNAKFLIMYSDSCFGQNKNSIVTTALMIAVKESRHLLHIEHKFLVPGHTHMEVDSDHALIERAKKKTSMNIHHPRDWSQLVRTASNKQNKFSVIEMTENDFYDFSNFSKQYLLIKKFNTEGQKFIWVDVRAMKFIKGEFPEFKYKESYKANDYMEMTYAKRNKDYSLININSVPKCYSGPVPISVQKKKDLLSLLEYIDPIVHDFYHNLTTNSNLRDINPDIISETE